MRSHLLLFLRHRDHSTVVYSIKAVEEQIDINTSFKEMVEDILKNTRSQ